MAEFAPFGNISNLPSVFKFNGSDNRAETGAQIITLKPDTIGKKFKVEIIKLYAPSGVYTLEDSDGNVLDVIIPSAPYSKRFIGVEFPDDKGFRINKGGGNGAVLVAVRAYYQEVST